MGTYLTYVYRIFQLKQALSELTVINQEWKMTGQT